MSNAAAAGLLCVVGLAGCSLVLPAEEDLLATTTSSTGASGAGGQDPASFDALCAADGVILCQGWDDEDAFAPVEFPDSGLYPADDKLIHGARDTEVRASGASSLRFDIGTQTAANAAGMWVDSYGGFGEESTLYAQFKQRFSSALLSYDWSQTGATSWSQSIFHHGLSTCAEIQLSLNSFQASTVPFAYSNCEASPLFTNGGVSPFFIQQGDYACPETGIGEDCFTYTADAWLTFSFEVRIGHFGAPDSHVVISGGPAGGQLRRFIDIDNFTFYSNSGGVTVDDTFNAVTLTPYFADKNAALDHPPAAVWYDDLIVSRQPIEPD